MEKGLGVQGLCMLIMTRGLYMGENVKQIFGGKTKENWEPH